MGIQNIINVSWKIHRLSHETYLGTVYEKFMLVVNNNNSSGICQFSALYLQYETQVVCDEPSAAQVEKLRWVERNVLVAAARVLKQMTLERDRARSVEMLKVCSELIDLDTTSLSVKILKHVSYFGFCVFILCFHRVIFPNRLRTLWM